MIYILLDEAQHSTEYQTGNDGADTDTEGLQWGNTNSFVYRNVYFLKHKERISLKVHHGVLRNQEIQIDSTVITKEVKQGTTVRIV